MTFYFKWFINKFERSRDILNETFIYFKTNCLVTLLLVPAVFFIVFVQKTQDSLVFFGVNADTVNFYLNVLVNLSIGYIVSTIFYILVVYYPHRKRVLLVKVRTHAIILRLNYRLKSVANLIVSAVNLDIDASEGVPQSYIDSLGELDLFAVLKSKKVQDPLQECSNALEHLIRDSSILISDKLMLVQLLNFMDNAELKFYTDLEKIYIFENMDKLDKWPFDKEKYLGKDFKYIVAAYNDCQNILDIEKTPIFWRTQPDFDDPSLEIYLNEHGNFSYRGQ